MNRPDKIIVTLCAIGAMLCCAGIARGENMQLPDATVTWSTTAPPPPQFKLPKFLLVRWEYSPSCTTTGMGPPICVGWYNIYREFDSLDDILKELNERGRYDSGKDIVGVFRLDDHSRVPLVSKRVQRIIPEHVKEQKWEETVWSVEK